jgi:hypothetical protein
VRAARSVGGFADLTLRHPRWTHEPQNHEPQNHDRKIIAISLASYTPTT